MKKIVTCLMAILVFTLSISVVRVLAAGTTSNPNQPGEVKIVDQDGVLYLTTETNENEIYSIQTASPASRPAYVPYRFTVPDSYAHSFTQLLNFLLRLVLALAALLVFAFLIIGAIEWITSGGDKGKVEKARGKIVAAVIGLLIVASSYAVLSLVLGFLGFGSLQDALLNVGTIQSGPLPTPETDLGAVILATPSATPN